MSLNYTFCKMKENKLVGPTFDNIIYNVNIQQKHLLCL